MENYKRHLVTAALPYANGPIHIGHLAGAYIPADIYVRYLRLKNEDVLFICGSDEHGVPITIKARQEGVTPQNIVDRYHSMNKKAFEDYLSHLQIPFQFIGEIGGNIYSVNDFFAIDINELLSIYCNTLAALMNS